MSPGASRLGRTGSRRTLPEPRPPAHPPWGGTCPPLDLAPPTLPDDPPTRPPLGDASSALAETVVPDAGAAALIAGRYRPQRLLGRGGAKEVWLAHDLTLERPVAIARARSGAAGAEARERMRREARLMARLGDHPNIVTVFDAVQDEGVLHIVARFMAGGSLAERLVAVPDGRLAPAEVLRAGRSLADALAHAHAHGVVHRDVKPDNVWLGADGSAGLGDFGIAMAAGDALETAGRATGTPYYQAPEQGAGTASLPAVRPLRAGRHPVGAAVRAPAVHGARRDGAARTAPPRGSGSALAPRSRHRAGARRARARAAGQAARGAARRRRRRARRARPARRRPRAARRRAGGGPRPARRARRRVRRPAPRASPRPRAATPGSSRSPASRGSARRAWPTRRSRRSARAVPPSSAAAPPRSRAPTGPGAPRSGRSSRPRAGSRPRCSTTCAGSRATAARPR